MYESWELFNCELSYSGKVNVSKVTNKKFTYYVQMAEYMTTLFKLYAKDAFASHITQQCTNYKVAYSIQLFLSVLTCNICYSILLNFCY